MKDFQERSRGQKYLKKILMIPGPTEYESNVLGALAQQSIAHTSNEFLLLFEKTLRNILELVNCKEGFPFILSGSGTLGMEIGTINFIKRDSKVLVVNNGFFGDRFIDLLSRYTKNIEVYKPSIGYPADPKEIGERVVSNEYDLVTVTHVETSVGMTNNIKEIAPYFKDLDTILAVDGVCSIGGEEFQMNWGVDTVFTASQKALGVPPGLAIGVIGPKALARMERNPPLSFFSDLRKWLGWRDLLQNKKGSRPEFLGTPNVNLVKALNVSLHSIFSEGMPKRIKRHKTLAAALRTAISELGLEMIPKGAYANTVSAAYLPSKIKQESFLQAAERYGVTFAGGLVPEIKDKYFRIGHMGAISSSEIIISISAIEKALKENGYNVKIGTGLNAAQELLYEYESAHHFD